MCPIFPDFNEVRRVHTNLPCLSVILVEYSCFVFSLFLIYFLIFIFTREVPSSTPRHRKSIFGDFPVFGILCSRCREHPRTLSWSQVQAHSPDFYISWLKCHFSLYPINSCCPRSAIVTFRFGKNGGVRAEAMSVIVDRTTGRVRPTGEEFTSLWNVLPYIEKPE